MVVVHGAIGGGMWVSILPLEEAGRWKRAQGRNQERICGGRVMLLLFFLFLRKASIEVAEHAHHARCFDLHGGAAVAAFGHGQIPGVRERVKLW